MASRDQEKEKAAANLLRQSLGDSGDDCPGPDTLAAYFERSLDGDESARYERHLARCTRCREQLAALDRAGTPDPAGGAPPHQPSFWPWLWDWRWLLPVAAALIVGAVWVARWPTPKRPPTLVVLSQPQQAPTTPESMPENGSASGEVPAPKSSPNLTSDLSPRGKPSPRATPSPSSKQAETDSLAAADAAASSAPASKNDALRAVGGRLEPKATTSNAETISREPSSMLKSQTASPAARVSVQGAKASLALEAVDRRSTREIISTPDPKVLWRIAEGGFVERTQDGGASWQAQLPVAGAQFTAGSAPSKTVCWLAGRGSMIALTTNAKDWNRIPPPVPADFVAIEASDVSNATVTTADGRKFTTSDGGVHWKLVL